MDPGGASNPVCRIALFALLAPPRMSRSLSARMTRAPSRANLRVTAQPTTPAPTTSTSQLWWDDWGVTKVVLTTSGDVGQWN